jgi:hypothetical protein
MLSTMFSISLLSCSKKPIVIFEIWDLGFDGVWDTGLYHSGRCRLLVWYPGMLSTMFSISLLSCSKKPIVRFEI